MSRTLEMKKTTQTTHVSEPTPEAEDSSWSRARRPEQKRERRNAILSAAVMLLDDKGVESTSLSGIARASGVSKANIYRYFESREAILLALTLDEAEAWLGEVTTRLAPLAGSGDIRAVAEVFATTMSTRPRGCALLSSLSSVLERNVGVELIAAFKRQFSTLLEAPTQAVHMALPDLSLDDAGVFMTFFYVFVAGIWPVSDPPPAVAEVLARPEFSDMGVDFEGVVRTHAHTVLRGLCRSD